MPCNAKEPCGNIGREFGEILNLLRKREFERIPRYLPTYLPRGGGRRIIRNSNRIETLPPPFVCMSSSFMQKEQNQGIFLYFTVPYLST